MITTQAIATYGGFVGYGIINVLTGLTGFLQQFSGSLSNVCSLADLKMNRLLDAIDDWINSSGCVSESGYSARFAPTKVNKTPSLEVDLAGGEVNSVIWATGYRPEYSWLNVPVLDRKGQILHDGGVVRSPGMQVLGLPFLRRRNLTFIHGVEDDAAAVTKHLDAYLDSVSNHMPLKLAV